MLLNPEHLERLMQFSERHTVATDLMPRFPIVKELRDHTGFSHGLGT